MCAFTEKSERWLVVSVATLYRVFLTCTKTSADRILSLTLEIHVSSERGAPSLPFKAVNACENNLSYITPVIMRESASLDCHAAGWRE